MKKLTTLALGLLCATALTLNAADGEKKKAELTPEQKAFREEMIKKYDTNKDGKLDKEEREKMSAEDKEKQAKLFPGKKKGEKKEEGK